MGTKASTFSQENANFFRLTKLLLDVGTDILREVFKTYYKPKKLDQYLSDPNTDRKIKSLYNVTKSKQKTILSKKQYDLLYPAAPGQADVNDFDITLLSCLLRNLHDTIPANDVVWSNPPAADTSIEADVFRIRENRNKLYAHIGSPELSEADYQNQKHELEILMVRMAGKLSSSSQSFLQDTKDKITRILLDEIEPYHKKLKKDLQRWQKQVETLQEKVDKLHDEVQEVQGDVTDVKQEVQEMHGKVTDVEEKIDKVDGKLDTVDGKVERVDGKVDKVDEKVDKVQDAVMSVKQEVKDIHSKLDNRQEVKEIDEERLRSSLLSSYQRSYSCISVNPLYEERDIPLDELFTDVVIVEETKDGKHTREVPVQSFRDIFVHRDNQENASSVVVLGEAGSGKTVYSQQMVNKWVKTQIKLRTRSKNSETEDEKMMARFDFLFYLPLRYIERSKTLMEAIYHTVGDDDLNQATTEHVFRKCPEKILVILDGLDEIEWYPSRHNFHMFTIVTTTRPWKYDVIKGKSPRKDRILKLRGLGENGVPKLAQRLRKIYYQDHPPSSVDNFLDDTEKLGLKDTLNESPLILVYLLHIWYQSNKLSTSLTANLLGIIECILQRGENKLISRADKLIEQDFALSKEEMQVLLLGSDRPACYKFGKLLMTAAKIAFNGLTNATREHTLIFSDSSLMALFGKQSDSLDACQKLGLISKAENIHILHKEHNISFPHKLFQELFTSLDIANNKDDLTEFNSYCNTLDKVFEMSKVFMFTTALCKIAALQLSNHVVDICDSDRAILDFRSDIFAKIGNRVEAITNMYVTCIEERIKVNPGEECELHISDMYVDIEHGTPNWSVLTTLLKTNSCRLKSFYFNTSSESVELELENVTNMLQQLTKVTSLKHLHMDCGKTYQHTVGYVNKILESNSQVCVLHLEGDEDSEVGDALLLPPLQYLQHLYIRQVSTTSETINGMSALGHLSTLQLNMIDIGDVYLDMSRLTHMHHLTLKGVTMSDHLWWKVMETMNNLPVLKEVVLCYPDARDGISSPPTYLKPTFVSKLHKMELADDASSPLLHEILSSIGDDCEIRELNVWWPDIETKTVTALMSAIPSLQHLEQLKLEEINADIEKFDLQVNKNLKILTFDCNTMSQSAWSQVFVSLRSLQHLTELQIDMFGIPDLDPTSWAELFDSLQCLHGMTLLKLVNVKISTAGFSLPSHLAVTHMSLDDDGHITWLRCVQKLTE